ncbi:hypothetical protein DAEQUDRAFT_709097 [Daedalea quercina L-15889]|uniref:Thioesterase/thiol ester dehydrase-isomerase n=1 Tax=Daedalea quercina L-15889 TaxID=1314783 RepID=A0A165R161_9APHY|nr:hypothetical protein DAEQUDRAFT_709097 [Daedalea quercina L-15889]
MYIRGHEWMRHLVRSGSKPWLLRCLPTSHARRCNSSLTVAAENVAALDRWIESTSKLQLHSTDTLRAEHLSDLYITLPTRNAIPGRWGSGTPPPHFPLGYGHHLVFFHPRNPESALRPDGTDADFCPPEPWTRRMWAGGRMVWKEPLSIGENVTASSMIDSVEKKGFDKGSPMVFVNQKIQYRKNDAHQGQAAIVEERSHVYLAAPGNRRGIRKVDGIPVDPDYQFKYLPSATTLFRFSALTFNAHFIHLDREYAVKEGYPERLVHGPLTALMLLEAFSLYSPNAKLKSFEYRAVNPLVVNRYVVIHGKEDKHRGVVQVWAEDADTRAVGMVGRIHL